METDSFDLLFKNYYQRFVRFADSYVRDRAVAEDTVTDAFVYYWENRSGLTPETVPEAYIMTIVKNRCINHLQHLQVRTDVSDKIREHAAWELNLRLSTLEACNPEELFMKEANLLI